MGYGLGAVAVKLAFQLLTQQGDGGIEIFMFSLRKQLTIGYADLCFDCERESLFANDDLGGDRGTCIRPNLAKRDSIRSRMVGVMSTALLAISIIM